MEKNATQPQSNKHSGRFLLCTMAGILLILMLYVGTEMVEFLKTDHSSQLFKVN